MTSANQTGAGEGLGPIKLYGFPTSPYVLKVAGYLGFKHLSYEFVGVNPVNFEQIAFSNQRQVPVLQIEDEWKNDSDNIAVWLDELFPQRPLLPVADSCNAEVQTLNDWVNHTVVPGMFRLTVDWPSIAIGFSNGWTLASVVNRSVSIPKWVQLLWPVLVRKASFIKRIVEPLDKTETLEHYQQRVLGEFTDLRGGGQFLGGRDEPSLADVSLYPLVLLGGVLGLKGDTPWNDSSDVVEWKERMSEHFRESPLPDVLQVSRSA